MVFHWFIQINRGAGRNIEASDPHGAYKDYTEGIVGVFEHLIQVLFDHPFAVAQNIPRMGGTVMTL